MSVIDRNSHADRYIYNERQNPASEEKADKSIKNLDLQCYVPSPNGPTIVCIFCKTRKTYNSGFGYTYSARFSDIIPTLYY